MSLSLRGRLSVWYAVVLSLVLALFATGFYFLEARARLRRVDEELARTASLLTRSMQAELAEGLDLAAAAHDALEDIELPGRSVAVFDEAGTLVGGTWPPAAGSGPSAPAAGTARFTLETPTGPFRAVRTSHRHEDTRFEVGVAESLLGLERDLGFLRAALLMSFLGSLAVALLGAWWIATGALRPLQVMAQEAQQAPGRATGFRLEAPNPHDELGALASSFNGLLARLDAVLVQQRQFMADASHELRTPVSIARTALEVALGRPARAEEEYRDALRVVAGQMRRLTRVVDDLLTFARADATGLRPAWEPLYLDELVADVVAEAKVLADAKGVGLGRAGAADVEARGDERLLRHMLLNLVDNAIRHTPAGGRVEVSLLGRDGTAEVSVADGGPGIAEADRARVFDRFVRLEGAGPSEGTGLGLPIARAIAEAHRGTLDLVRSDASGSTFVVRLPLSAA